MTVLMLSQGKPDARRLLHGAIEARYGKTPPKLANARLDLRGRVLTRYDFTETWLPLNAAALFRFPDAMRWDFTGRPPRRAAERNIESINGDSYYCAYANKSAQRVTQSYHAHAIASRMWALASVLLLPLIEMPIQIKTVGAHQFIATHTKLDVTSFIRLRDDKTVAYARTECCNNGEMQSYVVHVSPRIVNVDGFNVPQKISVTWDERPYFEAEVFAFESQLKIPDSIFNMRYESNVIKTIQA